MTKHLKSLRFADGEEVEAGELGGPSRLRVRVEAA